jgi:hypothetical protein
MTNLSGEYKGKQYEFRELTTEDHYLNETRAWHLLTPKAGKGFETARFETLEELKICIDIFTDGAGSNKTNSNPNIGFAIVTFQSSFEVPPSYKAVELFSDIDGIYTKYEGERYDNPTIVKEYSNFILAKQNVVRAEKLEKQLRVPWQVVFEAQRKLETIMFDEVYKVLRDEN